MQRYAIAVTVLVMMAVMVMAGCAAYDKAKDINIAARTEPKEFKLGNDGFDTKPVRSDTWEDEADKIKTVEKVEISYTSTNNSQAPVDLKVYISDNPALQPDDLESEATLVHTLTLPEGETEVRRDEALIENIEQVKAELKAYEGTFTVYVVAESISDTIDVDITGFQVYGTFNADLL
jgi:hypothetical protein